ncbi:hypothetical protein [Amycolatopsis japonica]
MTAPPMPEPVRNGRDTIEFDAGSVEEFMRMLRGIRAASGRTAGKVASYSGLPRSTAYHFDSPKNTTLPRDREQVEKFVRACKLNPLQVARVLWLWDQLAEKTPAEIEFVDAELVSLDQDGQAHSLIPQGLRDSRGGVVINGNINVTQNQFPDRARQLADDVAELARELGQARSAPALESGKPTSGPEAEDTTTKPFFLTILGDGAMFARMMVFVMVLALVVLAVLVTVITLISSSATNPILLTAILLVLAPLSLLLNPRIWERVVHDRRRNRR